MYNGFQVERLRLAIVKMKEGLEEFEQYCTENCGECPLYKANVCGYHLEIDPRQKITDGLLSNFIDYYERSE